MLAKIIAICFYMLAGHGFYKADIDICDREYWFISLGFIFGTILWSM